MNWFDKKNSLLDNVSYCGNIPLPLYIELNITNICNRNCNFCPYVPPSIEEEMPLDLYQTILNQLNEIGFHGYISFSGFCEPTLHSKIKNLISMTPFDLQITTNGDFLNKEKIDEYFSLGLTHMTVSAYEEITFKNFKDLNQENIFIQKRFSGDMFYSNRAGSMPGEAVSNPCFYPFYNLYINYNGDVVFCSHNYNMENILGNIEKESIWDIWTGDKLNNIRKNLINSKRVHSPCDKCSVQGTLMGGSYFEEWKNILS